MTPGLCRALPRLSAVHLFHPLSLHLCRHSLLSTFLSRHETTLKLGGFKGNIPHLQSFGHAHFSPTSASPLMWSFPSLPRIAFDNLRKIVRAAPGCWQKARNTSSSAQDGVLRAVKLLSKQLRTCLMATQRYKLIL